MALKKILDTPLFWSAVTTKLMLVYLYIFWLFMSNFVNNKSAREKEMRKKRHIGKLFKHFEQLTGKKIDFIFKYPNDGSKIVVNFFRNFFYSTFVLMSFFFSLSVSHLSLYFYQYILRFQYCFEYRRTSIELKLSIFILTNKFCVFHCFA